MLFKQSAQAGKPATNIPETAPATKLSLPSARPSEPIAPAADVDDTSKRLIVGEGIQLKGEITACERLIVEGQVEVTMKSTRVLEIKPSGRFVGSCEVEDAEVSGIYDGGLTVRGRLVVRAGGRVTGDISYGEIEIEKGAQVTGALSVREARSEASGPKVEVQRNAA